MLEEDGVTLSECEQEALSETGERIRAKILTRHLGEGRFLHVEIDFVDPASPVPQRTVRQIANRLRLPVEKYVFPDFGPQ